MRTRKIWALVSIFILSTLLAGNYINGRATRERAMRGPFQTMISPNKEYKVNVYYISAGEPMVLLFRIFDKENNLIAEYTRDAWPGAAVEDWYCDAGPCTKLHYEIGDAEPIIFPPTWLDRLRAKIP